MINESLDLEESIIGVILSNSQYMEQLVIDENCFQNTQTKKLLELLKKQYKDYHTIDIIGLNANYPDYFTGPGALSIPFITECITSGIAHQFDYYQECLFKIY